MNGETLLATLTEHHFVATDQEGWVWLVWGRCRIQLHPDDFVALVDLLARWDREGPCQHRGSCGMRVSQGGANMVQVWMVDTGLLLGNESFALLTDMMTAAQEVRVARSRPPACGRLHRTTLPLLIRTPVERPLN